MIFKTFQSDLDGISNKLGFSKRSFAEWGTQIKTSFSEGTTYFEKFKNTLLSMFIAQSSKCNDNWLRTNTGDIVSKDNIDSYIPKFDTDSARIELEYLQSIQNKINETKGSWDDYNDNFKYGRKYLLDYAKSNNVLEASVDNVKEANQQARTSALAHNEAIKSQSLFAKAGKVALQGLAMAGNMIVGWLFTKAIEVATEELYNFIHASEIAREKSKELTDNWDSENSSINDNISKYKELSEKLKGTSLSASEVKSVKEELLKVQDTLTQKYGQEALGIDLVNGKYDEQIEKLEKISKAKASDYVAENYSNIQEDEKYVTEKVNLNAGLGFYGSMAKPDDYSNVGFDLKKYLDRYDKLNARIVQSGSPNGLSGEFELITDGTREEIYNQLSQLFNDLSEDFGESDENVNKFKNTISKILQDSFDTEQLKTSKENIKKYAEAEILSQNKTRKLYEDAIDSVEKYNEALQSGKGIAEAKKNLDSVKKKVEETTSDISGASDVFDDVYSGINQTAENAYKVSETFEKNDSVKKYAEELKGLSSDELLKIDFEDTVQSPGEAAFKALIDIIGISEDETQVLIDKLVELGYVTGNVGDSDSKLSSFSEIIGSLGDDTIDNYTQKLSSLKSYLDKLKSGDFSHADKLSLADDFGITGDSVEELTEKIQNLMDSEMDAIIKQIDEILNNKNLDEETRRQVESLRQSIVDTNKEAKNLNASLSFKTNNPLADVQSLSQGLDQLDKIYADILDKEYFDWSSILNNEGFTKQFGAYTEEYEYFINTVSKTPNDINACQDAFNKLVAAYIYGSGVLDEVTEATKDGTIAMLEQMGVANASAIVTKSLRVNQEMLAAQKTKTAKETDNFTKATAKEIDELVKEEGYCEATRMKLLALAMQKQLVNGTTLDFSRDISNIREFVESITGASEALSEFERFKKSSYGYNNLPVGLRNQLEHNAQKEADEALKKANDPVSFEIPSIGFTGGSTTKDTLEKLDKEREKAEETAEQFDWLGTKLNNLIDIAFKAKDRISDLLSFGDKKKQTQKAIEATTKALEAEYRAMKKYSEIAGTLSADAAKATTETVTESVSGAVSDAVSNIASSTVGVVNDALQYVGKLPYVWAGASLTKGADCSGFTQQLYKAYGIELPHNSKAQYNSSTGIKVTNKQDLQPGDLVFFGSFAGTIHHVGIYAGNDQYIHEPRSGETAKVSYLSNRNDFVGGKRFGSISTSTSSSPVSYGTSSATDTYTKAVPDVDAKTLAHYQKLVREGSFDVETITNEKLKNAIKSYQEWYEKMKSCRDKIDELNSTLKELYQTMAQIPIEKRDKNVETLETRLDIINSRRDNINAVIVDPKKYASTKKTVKQSRNTVQKGLKKFKTKAQMAGAGLTKDEMDTIRTQMKKGHPCRDPG